MSEVRHRSNSGRMPIRCALAGALLLACSGAEAATSEEASSIVFTDVTSQTGIDLVRTSGRPPATQIVEVKGGGLALIDYDNDGDLDLFVPNGATLDRPDHGPGCRLYENLGGMKFRDVTERAGLTFNRWGMGVAVGDYDGDGHDDIFIGCFGRNCLLRNTRDGRFVEVTDAAGLTHDGWTTGCAFGDIDSDGDLDLYIADYLDFDAKNPPGPTQFHGVTVFAGPRGLVPRSDVLYENLGNGTFRDITAASGCGAVQPSYGLGVVILDFDRDGRQDIFVGNDSMKNFLFHNLGERRFEDVAVKTGIATNGDGTEQATMGIAIGDVDGNSFPDVFISVFSDDTNTLQLNREGRFFDDRSQQYGLGMITRTFLGWACMFYDFDHDGDEDLLIFNGHVYPMASRLTMNSEYLQPPLLFERTGKRFARVTDTKAGAWLMEPHCDRSAVFGDLDGDGDIDVIASELHGPLRVLRNDSPATPAGWLIVELRDGRTGVGNHRGLGACVRLACPALNATQSRWIFSGGSFQAACATSAHFGLPRSWLEPDANLVLEVTWPDGHAQRIEHVRGGRRLVVERKN